MTMNPAQWGRSRYNRARLAVGGLNDQPMDQNPTTMFPAESTSQNIPAVLLAKMVLA